MNGVPQMRGPGFSLAPFVEWSMARLAERPDPLLVEVGAFAGDGTVQLAEAFRVLSVDPWMPGYDVDDIASHADMGLVFAEFKRRAATCNGRVNWWRTTSADAARILVVLRPTIDVVYLDGNHQRGAVEADLGAWLPLVRDGGIIAGHDWQQSLHDGVTDAVLTVMGREPDQTFPDTSWAYEVTS